MRCIDYETSYLRIFHLLQCPSPETCPPISDSVVKKDKRKHSQRHVAGVGWPCCSRSHSMPLPQCTYQSAAGWGPTVDIERKQSFKTVSGYTTKINIIWIIFHIWLLAQSTEEEPHVWCDNNLMFSKYRQNSIHQITAHWIVRKSSDLLRKRLSSFLWTNQPSIVSYVSVSPAFGKQNSTIFTLLRRFKLIVYKLGCNLLLELFSVIPCLCRGFQWGHQPPPYVHT